MSQSELINEYYSFVESLIINGINCNNDIVTRPRDAEPCFCGQVGMRGKEAVGIRSVGLSRRPHLKVVFSKADLYAGALFITEATGFKGLNPQTIFKLDNFPKLTTVFS